MSLKYKFSLFIIVLVFVILSAITFVLIQSRSREIQTELTTRNTLLAQTIIPDLVGDLANYLNYSYSTYVELAQKRLNTYQDILRFRIYNPSGEEIFDTDTMTESAGVSKTPTKTTDAIVLKTFESKKSFSDSVTYRGQQTLRIIIPYFDKYDTFRMVLEFYFSTNEIRRAIQQVIVFSAVILVIATGSSVILTVLLVNQFTAPILRLTEAAGEISKGNLDVAVDIHSDDEIGQLAATFNQMEKDLKQSHEKLQSYNKDLENQVAGRTKQLQEQMEEMQRLQKLTIDRELKMVELKKEIENLKNIQLPKPVA